MLILYIIIGRRGGNQCCRKTLKLGKLGIDVILTNSRKPNKRKKKVGLNYRQQKKIKLLPEKKTYIMK